MTHEAVADLSTYQDRVERLVFEVHAVARDICMGDLVEFAEECERAEPHESLGDVLNRMHESGSKILRVRGSERCRDTVIPIERIERELATPFGQAIFMKRSVGYLLEETGFECLGISHVLTIGEACASAIARDESTRNDPVLVCEPDSEHDWVMRVQTLLLVQSSFLKAVLIENERQRSEVSQALRSERETQSQLSLASRKAAMGEHSTQILTQLEATLRELDHELESLCRSGAIGHEDRVSRVCDHALSLIEESWAQAEQTQIHERLSARSLWNEAIKFCQPEMDQIGVEAVEHHEECPSIVSDHRLLLRLLVRMIGLTIEPFRDHAGPSRAIELSTTSVIQCGVEGVRMSICCSYGIGSARSDFEEELGSLRSLIEPLGGAIWIEHDEDDGSSGRRSRALSRFPR